MVSHTLVKDVLMELGEETEYYTVKSGDSEPLDIRLRKRHMVYRSLRGFKSYRLSGVRLGLSSASCWPLQIG